MIRAGIVGASGYTGGELARILSLHPEVEITVATSRNYAEKRLSQVYPHLAGIADIVCEDVQIADLVHRADVFFTAVPHQTAMAIVPELLKTAGKKVIDLSADFRIDDPVVYEAWYQPHTAQEYLAEAVYGLPEINRDKIAGARLVANPGCYPTSIILALAPLLKNGLIDLDTIVADSKSGTSGAGRGAQVGTLFCEVADGFRAYKVGEHRHTPEIEQELAKLAGSQLTISFTPHLLPVSRGILSTIYGKLTRDVDQQEISDLFLSFYQDEKFVRICRPGNFPATQYVRGSNYCDIGCKVDTRTGRVVLVSVIDNLVKGAAGQAVQNMNVVCGFQESLGLETVPLFP